MVRNFITRHIPVGDQGIVCVVQGSVVSHLDSATVGVLPVREELIDRIEGVGLDGIVGGVHDEHGNVRLEGRD